MAWWKSPFRKPDDAQLDSELRFHIEGLVEEKIAAGLGPEEARRQALLEFGGQEQWKEELRDVHRVAAIENTLSNLKFAFRGIRKSPSFAGAIIVTLALGIGANSAIFSALDAILLRPLPFPHGDQLMSVIQYNPKVQNPESAIAPVRIEDWNRMNSTFQVITAYYTEDISESSGTLPEKITRAWVAPRFFQVWGIAPALGREFLPEDSQLAGSDSVIVSDRFWRHRFGADPNAIGKKVRIDPYSYSIVGIMPASFLFPQRDVDLWFPSPLNGPYTQSRESTWYTGVGRLKPGVTVPQARADLATVQAQLGKEYPKTDADLAAGIQPLKESKVGGVRRSLWILFGSVSVLLLIACTNIAALLLARTAERQREISIRYSLGASRGAIVMQLLTEVFVLALAGATLALLVAGAASGVLHILAKNLPRVEEIGLNGRLVLYTAACAVLTTLLCGLFPAVRGTRRSLAGSLAQAGRTQVSGRNPLQWVLVSVQVALAVTLLVGAGLLLRTFQALGRVSPGFERDHVLTFRISANWGETVDQMGLRQRMDRDLDALRSIPGVEGAATSLTLPGVPFGSPGELKVIEGQADPNHKIVATSRFVSAGYFETMHIPLLAGEPCRETQVYSAVVNRSFADTYLRGRTAIGSHVGVVPANPYLESAEIRGIVADAREEGLGHEPSPMVYFCLNAPVPSPAFLLRTQGEPMALAETVRHKVHDIEPNRSVYEVMPLEEHLRDTQAESRLRTALLTFFALTAVALACMGLYGTLSYIVSTRRREVGLRLAVGALRGQVVTQFLFEGLRASVLGCLAGLGLAAAFSRLLSKMLYGISPSDTATFAGVALLVLVTGTLACLLPAARAARVDPMQVLRDE
jgi:putative ABC transport system permease protein